MYIIDLTNNTPSEYNNYNNKDKDIYYEYDFEKIDKYNNIFKSIIINKDLLIISICYITFYIMILLIPIIKKIKFTNFNKISLFFSIIKFFLVLKTI